MSWFVVVFLFVCFLSICLLNSFTHFIPLRCMIHSTMVAFTQNRMKKSTVSARNLWRGEGMVYSRPVRGGWEDRCTENDNSQMNHPGSLTTRSCCRLTEHYTSKHISLFSSLKPAFRHTRDPAYTKWNPHTAGDSIVVLSVKPEPLPAWAGFPFCCWAGGASAGAAAELCSVCAWWGKDAGKLSGYG